jgi:hypothetical protein
MLPGQPGCRSRGCPLSFVKDVLRNELLTVPLAELWARLTQAVVRRFLERSRGRARRLRGRPWQGLSDPCDRLRP